MTERRNDSLNSLWDGHGRAWRDPFQVAGQTDSPLTVDSRLLEFRVQGEWWEILHGVGGALLVSREYEHLLMALSAGGGRPALSYMPLPHPSGMVFDELSGTLHLACTRNPNQVIDFKPVAGLLHRSDLRSPAVDAYPLIPVRSRFYPGSLYIHDLAMIGGKLHANAVGHNAVVRLDDDGAFRRVWWPRCIEGEDGPDFSRNYLQLNSIAAGDDLESSWFSASGDKISSRRPGHRNFPVERRGVIFAGSSRQAEVRGLTRPHSARLHRDALWVANSGYGELLRISGGKTETVCRLPGWTRGLCFRGDVAFVATSRVIPRYSNYAPGLDVELSVCGITAVDIRSGAVRGSISWPWGNQIFALEWLPEGFGQGLPCRVGRSRRMSGETRIFYSYTTEGMP